MIAKNEKDALNRSFRIYEILYLTLITIIFTSTLVLVVPFVKIYTSGITDADYYKPIFASILVLAEFMWAIRLPYSTITLSAGHFKETKKGAWLEASINIILSIVLVFKYGLDGVAIGTFIAMLIRTIEFMYHSSKYILNRNLCDTFKVLFIIFFEIALIICICNSTLSIDAITYMEWITQGIIVTFISTLICATLNSIFYKGELKSVIQKISDIIFLRKKQ